MNFNLVIFVQTGLTSLKCTLTVCRTLSPVLMSNYPLNESFGLLQIHIQDFASALLENFNCIVGVITSLQLYRRLSIITSISIKDILQKV